MFWNVAKFGNISACFLPEMATFSLAKAPVKEKHRWGRSMGFQNNGSPLYTVDSQTGELTPLVIDTGDRVIRSRSVQSYREIREEYVSLNEGRPFIKLFPDMAAALTERLTAAEIQTLFLLLPYVGINSGILMHTNGKFLTRKHMVSRYADARSTRTLDRSMQGLVRKGVIAKCYIQEKMAYIANPYLFQRGSKANATLLTLFEKTEWAEVLTVGNRGKNR